MAGAVAGVEAVLPEADKVAEVQGPLKVGFVAAPIVAVDVETFVETFGAIVAVDVGISGGVVAEAVLRVVAEVVDTKMNTRRADQSSSGQNPNP